MILWFVQEAVGSLLPDIKAINASLLVKADKAELKAQMMLVDMQFKVRTLNQLYTDLDLVI